MELIVGGRNPHQVVTVRCSHCSALKQTVNHWWMLSVIDGALVIEAYDDKLWAVDENESPVCGNSCAAKKVEQFLSTGKLL